MGVAAKEHKETEFTGGSNGRISLTPNVSTDKINTGVPKKERTNFLLTLVIAAAAAYVDATGFLLYSGIPMFPYFARLFPRRLPQLPMRHCSLLRIRWTL